MVTEVRYTAKPDEELKRKITALWKDVFGDGEEFVFSFFELSDYIGTFYACDGEKVVGMAHLLGFDSYKKAYYVYAVATEKESRGKGIMREIMKAACRMAKGENVGLILHPADGKLADSYARLGFKAAAYSYTAECSGDAGRYSLISASEYKVMRELFYGGMGFYGWSSEIMTASGCKFIAFDIDGDYCGACIKGDTVIEVCAPFSAEGMAYRRAAGAMGEKGRVMMFCDNPIDADVAVMTFNCEKYGYFNMFLD